MDDQEKLDAIRAAARREASEKEQAAQASRRRDSSKQPLFTAGHLALALIAVVGLTWIYLSKPPEKPNTYQQDLERLTAATREYEDQAFRVAAIRQLRRDGIQLSAPDFMEAGRLSGNIYTASFSVDGKSYQLKGQYVCSGDGLMETERQDPACYLWR